MQVSNNYKVKKNKIDRLRSIVCKKGLIHKCDYVTPVTPHLLNVKQLLNKLFIIKNSLGL